MFGPLIVIYLFLAGAGCGTFVAAVYLSQRARSSAAPCWPCRLSAARARSW